MFFLFLTLLLWHFYFLVYGFVLGKMCKFIDFLISLYLPLCYVLFVYCQLTDCTVHRRG